MNKKKIFSIFLLIILTGCGFKIINQTKLLNFNIVNIESSGDKKINYILKNTLSFISKNDSNKKINLVLNTSKTRSIKEKNIKNEITKYNILIKIDVEYNKTNSNQSEKFTVLAKGDYDVSTQYSQTLNNEKKIIELLSNKLSEEIISKLIINLNDI